MIEENDEYYNLFLDNIDMAKLMEDVEIESGSQKWLRCVDAEDPAHEKKGTMVTLERPGISGEAHSSGCLYYKQTVFITTVTVTVFLSCYSNMFLNYCCGFENA